MTKFKRKTRSERSPGFLKVIWIIILMISVLVIYYLIDPIGGSNEISERNLVTDDPNRVENGIHVRTGLVDAPNLNLVIANCTGCHSAKLITQNRLTENQWNATIKWMQETQNLWDLGEHQEFIVDYLVTNYPLSEMGRRENLINIEWYLLEQ